MTALLKTVLNAIGVMLGNGWYRGIIGFTNNKNVYGKDIALICQVDIAFTDGTPESNHFGRELEIIHRSDPYSEIYNGETVDAKLGKNRMDLARL